jgi:hypothetical protein
VRAAGLGPATHGLKSRCQGSRDKDLRQRLGSSLGEDPDFERVRAAWPTLPKAIRAAVLTLVREGGREGEAEGTGGGDDGPGASRRDGGPNPVAGDRMHRCYRRRVTVSAPVAPKWGSVPFTVSADTCHCDAHGEQGQSPSRSTKGPPGGVGASLALKVLAWAGMDNYNSHSLSPLGPVRRSERYFPRVPKGTLRFSRVISRGCYESPDLRGLLEPPAQVESIP